MISDTKQLECAAGSVPITSADQCAEAAAAKGLAFAGTEEEMGWPTNCYVYNGASVYFNFATSGSAQCFGAPLCVIDESGPGTSAPTPNTTQQPMPETTQGPRSTESPWSVSTEPPTENPTPSSYVTSAPGTNECLDGSVPITSADGCAEAAASEGLTFGGTEEMGNYPKSCYVYHNQAVYFNFHTSGQEQSWSAPLCAPGGGGSATTAAPAPAGTTAPPSGGRGESDTTAPPATAAPSPGTTAPPTTAAPSPGTTAPPATAAPSPGTTAPPSGGRRRTTTPPSPPETTAPPSGGRGPPAPSPPETTAPPPSPSYVLGTKKKCPKKHERILDSLSDCVAAADLLGIDYGGEESAKKWPTGCYAYNENVVYFNHHTKDKKQDTAKYVCVGA